MASQRHLSLWYIAHTWVSTVVLPHHWVQTRIILKLELASKSIQRKQTNKQSISTLAIHCLSLLYYDYTYRLIAVSDWNRVSERGLGRTSSQVSRAHCQSLTTLVHCTPVTHQGAHCTVSPDSVASHVKGCISRCSEYYKQRNRELIFDMLNEKCCYSNRTHGFARQ